MKSFRNPKHLTDIKASPHLVPHIQIENCLTFMDNTENIVSLSIARENPPSTSRYLLTSREQKEELLDFNSKNISIQISQEIINSPKKKAAEKKRRKYIAENSSEYMSQISGNSKISRIYKNAVSSNYYPSYYNIVLIFFLFAFFCLLIDHIVFQYQTGQDIQRISSNKKTLLFSDDRDYLLSLLNIRVRLLWEYSKGKQDQDDYEDIYKIPILLPTIKQNVIELSRANQNFLKSVKYLEPSYQNHVFNASVKFYESYYKEEIYSYLTTGQAFDRIISHCLQGVDVARYDLNTSMNDFELILRNALNDLSYRNYINREVFVRDQNQFKEITQKSRNIYLSSLLGIFIFILMTLTAAGWKQIQKEKNLMSTVVKSNSNSIENLKNQSIQFKKNILEDIDFESLDRHSSYGQVLRGQNKNKEKNSGKKIKSGTKSPKAQGINKRYYLYILKAGFLFFILVAMIINVYLFSLIYIDDALDKFNQLSYWNHVKTNFGSSLSVAVELISENGTTLIFGIPSPNYFQVFVDSFHLFKDKISILFKEEDFGSNSALKEILYGDACSFIVDPLYIQYCITAQNGANSISLVQLFTNYEVLLTDLQSQYQQSNKSSESLKQLQLNFFHHGIIPTSLSVINLVSSLAGILKKSFDLNLQHHKLESDLTISLGSVVIIILGISMYFLVINKMRGRETEFRKVLQALPIDLVFSNFILKSYLIQTSKGAFDSIKNKI